MMPRDNTNGVNHNGNPVIPVPLPICISLYSHTVLWFPGFTHVVQDALIPKEFSGPASSVSISDSGYIIKRRGEYDIAVWMYVYVCVFSHAVCVHGRMLLAARRMPSVGNLVDGIVGPSRRRLLALYFKSLPDLRGRGTSPFLLVSL